MKLVMGHVVLGVVHEFPHLCPGFDCAIGRWMAAKQTGTDYKLRERPEAESTGIDCGSVCL